MSMIHAAAETPSRLRYDLNGNLVGSEVECLGDADGDHDVDTDDLAIVSAAYGYAYPDPEYDPRADFDGDGDVDEDDAWVWVDNANAACAFVAFAYDYRNRLVEVELRHDTLVQDPPPPPITHRYGYDAFGRRVKRTLDVGTGEERTVYFIYGGNSGWQLLEEWEVDATSGPELNAMFVHSGLYIDDVVQMRRWNGVEEAFEDFYYHCDDLSSVRALTDEDGELVELYDYHEFGLPTITDPNTIVNGRPALLASSAFGNPFLFTGQMYDAETRLYHYRTRPYEPRMGRFISVDSIGVWGDGANLGNGYAYVGNMPADWVDPWGLSRWDLPSYDPGLNPNRRLTPPHSERPPRKPDRFYRDEFDAPFTPGRTVRDWTDMRDDLGDIPSDQRKVFRKINIGGHGKNNTLIPMIEIPVLDNIEKCRENPDAFPPGHRDKLKEYDRFLRDLERLADCVRLDSCNFGDDEERMRKLRHLYPGTRWEAPATPITYLPGGWGPIPIPIK